MSNNTGTNNSSIEQEATNSKLPRLEIDNESSEEYKEHPLHDFSKFHLVEVLDNSQRSKYVALLGRFDDSSTDADTTATKSSSSNSQSSAILLLEKEAFPVEQLKREQSIKLVDSKSKSETIMHNDIWHKYRLALDPSLCLAKATLVHPATDRLANKYRRRPMYLVTESPRDYAELTEPALAAVGAKHSLTWVSNLLDGSAERDRLVFDDPDPSLGFVLHADLKWDGRRTDDLYCLAVCRLTGLHSLRQLGSDHLPLLENLMSKGRTALKERYGVPISQQRVFLHYQPSFYHLHAHFTHVSADWPGQQAERAHLLNDVISNIRLMPDYYQRATLTFSVKEGEPLYDAYKHQLDLL